MQFPSTVQTPRVFVTGVTGFVGRTVLSSLCKNDRDHRIKALIRKGDDAKELQRIHPNLTPIIGDLSSHDFLQSTAADSDFVIHMGGDDAPAVCAMIDGLPSSPTDGPPLPRLISLTGPRSLIDPEVPITGNANINSRPWSDVKDVHTILNFPKERMHTATDRAIIAHAIAKSIGVMLVSPGQLWGRGKGHLKKESHAALYYATVKSRGRTFVIGDGSATWSWTSIGDLGDAVVLLMEQANLSVTGQRGPLGVNEEGYYFVQTGDFSLAERAKAVTERLGLDEVERVSIEAAKQIHPFGHIMWGCGERTRADRLAERGWRPKDTDWKVSMEEEGGQRA